MVRSALATLSLVVAATAVVAPPASAGGGCHRPEVMDARTTVVDMRHNCFTPIVARVDVGDAVVFRNSDAVPHTVTGAGATPMGGGRQLATAEEVRQVFRSPGVFPYSCVLHPGMVGVVVVGDGLGGDGAPASTDAAATVDTVRAVAASAPAPPPGDDGAGPGGWPWIAAAGALALTGVGLAARRGRRPADGG